jgi:hypothetical protein
MVADVSEEVAASSFRTFEVQEKLRGLNILKMEAANCAEIAADSDRL